MMRVTFGCLVIAAGICGTLSFGFLAASLGTEYWYIIEMNPVNMSDLEDMSSHSGLWSINEGSVISFFSEFSVQFHHPAMLSLITQFVMKLKLQICV